MSQSGAMQTYDLNDIVAVVEGCDETPGNLVRHVNDKKSCGVVVAFDPEKIGFSKQPRVTVLWSKSPNKYVCVWMAEKQTQKPKPISSIKTQKVIEDHLQQRFPGAPIPNVTIELQTREVYDIQEFNDRDLRELSEECTDVVFNQDGTVVVTRTTRNPNYGRFTK